MKDNSTKHSRVGVGDFVDNIREELAKAKSPGAVL